ncbi:uncharacterized protein LOC143849418 [Tasmannia lanceolata]|uniref:uncharacterized protein LOC143849418 n=1 Tax=Tasmannia lanceolata TaxID=3420 RepID=UPI004063D0AC
MNIGSLTREKALLSEVLYNDTARNLPIWKPNSNGLFTAKNEWEVTRQKFVKPGWASRIWFSCHIPRHALVSWKALKNGLSTTDNLPFLDPSVNRSCILGNSELESVNHLFFQCNYSKWIWNIILGKLGHRRNPNPDLLLEELWLANNFKGAGQTSKLAYIAFEAAIYIIWIERNNRVFHKISLPNSALLSEILILVRSKVLGMKIEEEDNPSNRAIASNFGCTLSPKFRPPQFCSWLKPVQGTFKINSDASLDAEGGGIGGAIRDNNGFLVSMFSVNVEREEILALEICAVLAGLQMASSLGLVSIWMEVDSKIAADVINGKSKIPWRCFNRIQVIHQLLSHFQN